MLVLLSRHYRTTDAYVVLGEVVRFRVEFKKLQLTFFTIYPLIDSSQVFSEVISMCAVKRLHKLFAYKKYRSHFSEFEWEKLVEILKSSVEEKNIGWEKLEGIRVQEYRGSIIAVNLNFFGITVSAIPVLGGWNIEVTDWRDVGERIERCGISLHATSACKKVLRYPLELPMAAE